MRHDSIYIFRFTPPIDGTFPVSFFQSTGDKAVFRVGNHRLHALAERGLYTADILLYCIHQFFPELILLHETRDFFIALE